MNIKPLINQNHDSGFTLIEILIALTLFSVTLILIFSGLNTTSRSWLASERQIEKNEIQRLVIAFVKRQLGQTVPLIQLDGKKNNLLFKGTQHSLQFVSALPAHRGGGGLYLLNLEVDMGLNLQYQMMSSDVGITSAFSGDNIHSQSLIPNIDTITFSYFGSEQQDEIPSWHKQWENKNRLPDIISMRLTSTDLTTYWPEIRVPVRTQTSRGQAQLTINNKKTGAAG